MQQTPVKQNPIMFYLRVLLYVIIALLIRGAALAPLAFLFTSTKWLAVLCPILLIFVVLPLRFSFAQAMVQRKGERHFSFAKAFSLSDYSEKLKESFFHALNVLKWGLPLAALGAYGYYWYTGVDALTLLQTLSGLGVAASGVWCAIYNFIGGIFGWAEKVPVVSGLMEGVFVVLGAAALAVLVWMYGAVRNSATRYVWAIAAQTDRAPRVELRRRMRGRRWLQLGVSVINMLMFVPFVLVVFTYLRDTLSSLSTQLMMIIAQGSMPEVDLASIALPVAAAFALLYLPLVPIRRWLTVAFACGERRQKSKSAASAQQ